MFLWVWYERFQPRFWHKSMVSHKLEEFVWQAFLLSQFDYECWIKIRQRIENEMAVLRRQINNLLV